MRCGLCTSAPLEPVDEWGFRRCPKCGAGTRDPSVPVPAQTPIGEDDLDRYHQEVEEERAEDLAVLRDHAAVKRDGKPRGG